MKLKTFSKVGIVLLLFFVITIYSDSSGFAKELYVATNGNNSITYANNDINNPWLTPLKAWTEARAGDTVYFRVGTYNISSQIRTKFIGNDGTPENPITFRNYESESVTFSSDVVSLSGVFSIQKKYNHVQGINFTGSACTWFGLGEDNPADGFEISNCTVALGSGGDNTGFVGMGPRSPNAVVKNCRIVGPGTGGGIHQNTAVIFLGRATGVKILNNELSNAPMGIYFKHANTQAPSGNEIAYNYIHDTSRYSIFINGNYTNVHDNLIGANNGDFRLNEDNGVAGGDHNTINHNTIYSGRFILSGDVESGDPLPGARQNIITNNIFIYTTEYHRFSGRDHQTTADYNLYPTGTAVIEDRIDYTLAEWKTHSAVDINSIAGNPTFLDGATPSVINGFRLGSSSTGYKAGSGGKDVGADLILVGFNRAPLAPLNLQISE